MNIESIKKLDKFFGTLLVVKLGIIGKIFRRKPKKIKKILVIMFWGIGSNINSIPIVRELKRNFGDAKVDVLAPRKNKDVFYGNNNIDNLVYVDLSLLGLFKTVFKIWGKYDVVIDTEHWLNVSAILSFFAGKERIGFCNRTRNLIYTQSVEFDKKKHAVDNNFALLNLLNIKAKDKSLDKIGYSSESEDEVHHFLLDNSIDEKKDFVVGICAGSGGTVKERRWPAERFAVIADELVEKKKAKVIFVGSPDEKELVEHIQSLMKNQSYNNIGMSLGGTIALIEKCKLFISNDTGPMHIAAAQDVPLVGLFGPETPEIFGPYSKKSVSLFKKIECSPCIKIYRGRHIKCINNHKCMQLITLDEVKDAIETVLKLR